MRSQIRGRDLQEQIQQALGGYFRGHCGQVRRRAEEEQQGGVSGLEEALPGNYRAVGGRAERRGIIGPASPGKNLGEYQTQIQVDQKWRKQLR